MPSDHQTAIRGFHRDKRNSRPGEVIGGGYIVARRGRDSGRLRMHQWPFEHDTYESAHEEAQRLAVKNPGKQFVVIHQPVSEVICVPEDLPEDIAAADAA